MSDLSKLTEAEFQELRDIAARQRAAHIARDYVVSDGIRAELMAWGAWPPEKGWLPAFEASDHRQVRLEKRRAG